MKIKVYIAGPMRGIPHFNMPAFHEAAATLRKLNFHVFSPAEMDEIFSPTDLNNESGVGEAQPIHNYIRRDLHIIVNELTPGRDGIVLLPGWDKSSGATAERAVAKWCKLNIWTIDEIIHTEGCSKCLYSNPVCMGNQ